MGALEATKNLIKQVGNLGRLLGGFKLLNKGKNVALDSLMGLETFLH
jgi:hypothetical protein